MSPEQARGDIHKVRETADQYSAGVVLYELLTGNVPFEGGPMVVLLHNVINTPPPPPSEFRADLDLQLEAICLKALAKAPEERFPSCRAFADALRNWQTMRGTPGLTDVAAIVEPVPQPVAAAPTVSLVRKGKTLSQDVPGGEPPLEELEAADAGRRWQFLGVIAAAGVVLALAMWLVVGVILKLTTKDGRGEMIETKHGKAPQKGPITVGDSPKPLTGNNTAAEVRQAQEAWAKYLGRKVEEEDEVNYVVKMQFVLIPPGTFWMGSPDGEQGRTPDEEQHEVTITQPFYLGKYEVTQLQYEALLGKQKNQSQFKGANLPVEMVDWNEANGYAKKWTSQTNSNRVYRLPR